MKVFLGMNGLHKTWQKNFTSTIDCIYCNGIARIGFVGYENEEGAGHYVSDLHKNDPADKHLWLHDACAVAVYFCKKCLRPTAEYNQA